MPQLHFTVDVQTIAQLTREANAAGLSLSRYLARLVKREGQSKWPAGYLEKVIGACAGAPIELPDDVPPDELES